MPIVVHSADAPELKMGEEFQRDPLQLTYVEFRPIIPPPTFRLAHSVWCAVPPVVHRFHRHYYALGEHYNSVAVAGEVNAE